MIKLVNSRKGVAPLTVAAFLACMVGAVIFTAYLWQSAVIRVAHAIQIQGVLFESSKLIVYVQNVGEGKVTVTNAYIDGDIFDVDSGNSVVNLSNTNVLPEGETAEITIYRAYDRKINIKVVCSDGTVIEGDYKPPLN